MNRPYLSGFLILLSWLALVSTVPAQDSAAGFKAKIKPFLEAHCIDCHGPDTKKAGLRLDELKADFADATTAAQWIKVLDKVHGGEMPPKNRPRPAAQEAAAVTHWLRATLHEASLHTQRQQGRVVLRRLNRTEYETTLRDLLAAPVEVKDLLPEDSAAAGFDNISAVLDVSAVHLLRYQEAADKVLRAVIPNRPQTPSAKLRRSGRDVTEKVPLFKDPVLGQAPLPPPPGTPAIDPDIRGATTIRQQLDKHRHTPACASCHRHIDPPGFALENFDAIGGWRDFYRVPRPLKPGAKPVDLANYPGKKIYRGLDVEKGGELPDGRAFKNIIEYKQLLLTDKDQLARNLAQKLLIYATGADIQFADREVVEQLVARSREQKYGFRSLLHEVVQSRVFLSK